jgi:hypothetical protein
MDTATVIACSNRTTEDIAADLLAAKKLKSEADKMVLEMEQELIAALGQPDEGSRTHRLNGFKVELKGVVNRRVDWDILDEVVSKLEREEPFFVAPIKMKRELDETYFRRLYKDQPGIYARLAAGVTATPGKVGVTVSRTE